MSDEFASATATELVNLISSKQASPVELVEAYLGRIDRLDPQLHSFLLVTPDEAMKRAAEAEAAVMRGDPVGPLHGLPIAIKDTQMTGGVRTTQGSLLFKDRVPDRDAAVVERVKAAGAIALGKTNVPEFGLVGTCENRLGEYGRNPWDTERTPGGSSGGAAAAVAARLCPAALGSDGGGSIRIPANFCGIYGIKPGKGRVSGYTGQSGPPMPYMLSQNGPLTRTVRDAALLLQVIAGHDPRDPTSLRESPPDFIRAVGKTVEGLRIAWSPDFGFAKVDPEVLDITSRAARVFEDLGCNVEESDIALDPPYDVFGPVIAGDFHTNFGRYIDNGDDQFTEYAKFLLERGSRVTVADYARALGEMDRLKARMTDLFERFDLLLTPTACFPPFKYGTFPGEVSGISEYPDQYWNGAFTLPINVIGHPAASVPAGFTSDGLPVGLHVVGKELDEVTVLAASAAFESAQPWDHIRPAVS